MYKGLMLSMYVCNVKYNANYIGGQKLKKTTTQNVHYLHQTTLSLQEYSKFF